MTVLGSVFLGDAHHHRVFSPTPPTSPPPSSTSTSFAPRAQEAPAVQPLRAEMQEPERMQTPPPAISPAMSLELRLRWLEALLLGVRQDAAKERQKSGDKSKAAQQEERSKETLYRRAEDVQQNLEAIVASNDGLKRFMEHYDRHAQFLTPSFALSGLPGSSAMPPPYNSMSPAELDAFLSEMESDIRAADRDLREIDALEKRGVTGAGKLADHEPLQPRLQALVKAHEEDLARAAQLENRIANLLEKHASKVDALSELFVAWNDAITKAEDDVSKAERERQEQRRMGFE